PAIKKVRPTKGLSYLIMQEGLDPPAPPIRFQRAVRLCKGAAFFFSHFYRAVFWQAHWKRGPFKRMGGRRAIKNPPASSLSCAPCAHGEGVVNPPACLFLVRASAHGPALRLLPGDSTA